MADPKGYDAAGRLFSIVAALILAGRKGLNKEELFRVVEPYQQQIRKGVGEEALEQMFTRDKDALRNNGFDITPDRTISGDRYSLVEKDIVFPSGQELSPRQLQLLNLATEVWNQGSISAEVGRAAIRMRGLGISASANDVLNIAPRIQTHEPSFLRLSEAVASHIRVEFDYRKPGGTAIEHRRVQPWALRNVSSQWLLQCWDEDQQDVRNFLLKRIVSPVKFVKIDKALALFDAPSASALQAAKASLQEHIDSNVAQLRIRNGSEAWFHFVEANASKDEWVDLEVKFMDEHLLAEDLRAYGADVRVVSPEHLRAAISAGLEKVVAAHA
jgi:proteasome accessory factor B